MIQPNSIGILKRGVACALLAGALGCAFPSANLDAITAEDLFVKTCRIGLGNQTVTGSIWVKVDSKEMQGQFPATLRATAPQSLDLEVTDLVGAPQAVVRIQDDVRRLKAVSARAKKNLRDEDMKEVWAGIPLSLAPAIFLGRYPCPTADKEVSVRKRGESLEILEKDLKTKLATHYLYEYRGYGGEPFPVKLTWRRELSEQKKLSIVLEFADLKDPGPLATRWTATSDRGQVDVRWKDYQIKAFPSPSPSAGNSSEHQ